MICCHILFLLDHLGQNDLSLDNILYAGTKNRSSLLLLLNCSIVSVQHGNLWEKKTSRVQEEKHRKTKCGRRRKLQRERTFGRVCRGNQLQILLTFKAFLAASLHALWRNKHGIKEHLFQSSHVKHVCTKVCHAISLIQPPSGRGTDQKLQENNQISFIHFLRFLPLPRNIALLEFTSDHRAEEGLRLVTFLLSKYKKYKILYTPHCHLKQGLQQLCSASPRPAKSHSILLKISSAVSCLTVPQCRVGTSLGITSQLLSGSGTTSYCMAPNRLPPIHSGTRVSR